MFQERQTYYVVFITLVSRHRNSKRDRFTPFFIKKHFAFHVIVVCYFPNTWLVACGLLQEMLHIRNVVFFQQETNTKWKNYCSTWSLFPDGCWSSLHPKARNSLWMYTSKFCRNFGLVVLDLLVALAGQASTWPAFISTWG